jgi:hypothetical protein
MSIIIAYHTPGLYEVEARRLMRSMSALGLHHVVHQVADAGSWVANCQLKARFIRDMRQRLAGDLLYVDVDAVIHANPWPELQQIPGDIVVHRRDGHELLSGTILLREHAIVDHLLDHWIALNAQQPQAWDQRTLDVAIAGTPGLRVGDLPARYCAIFDLMANSLDGPPVIEHLQASRERHGQSAPLDRRRARLRELEH